MRRLTLAPRWQDAKRSRFSSIWCKHLALTEKTQAAISEVRSRNPYSPCWGRPRTTFLVFILAARWALTIQFESHRVELAVRLRDWSTIETCWSITISRPLFRSSY